MAINAAMVWEVRGTASSINNGGGFNPSNAIGNLVDYSQQDSAQYNFTNLSGANANTGTPDVSSASHTFINDDVGNVIHITAGTNWTAGWYEIISVSAGAARLDRACASVASPTNGTFFVGGSLPNFNTWSTNTSVLLPGNKIWVKGSITSSTTITMATGSAANGGITMEGYNATRGDSPAGSNRPVYTMTGGAALTFGAQYRALNIIFLGSGTNVVSIGSNGLGFMYNCKVINSSSSANQNAVNAAQGGSYVACEFASYRGNAMSGASNAKVFGCYFHNSNVGLDSVSAVVTNCVFDGCTKGINISGASNAIHQVTNCTLFGRTVPYGDGIYFQPTSGTGAMTLFNCIISGFTTGINSIDPHVINNYCDFYNNTSNFSGSVAGANNLTSNPSFANVVGLSGSTATTGGSALTQSGADFSSVVDNQDCVVISSGTGVTTGIYLITAHTTSTLTLDAAPGANATADKVWAVTTGRDFDIGSAMKSAGFPSLFPGGLSTTHLDLGGIQSQGGTSTDPGEANVRAGVGYIISDVSKTGLAYIPDPADVRFGEDVEQTTGLAHIPDPADVRFGEDVEQTTGLAHIPAAADVRVGVDIDQTVGLIDLPLEATVLDGIFYDNNTKEGTLVAGGGGGGDCPTAEEIADAVWNQATADITTPDSIGDLIKGSLPVTVPTVEEIEDAVWDAALSDHTGEGTFGGELPSGGGGGDCPTVEEIADAVWDEAIADHDTDGTFGHAVQTGGGGGGDPEAVAEAVWDYPLEDAVTANTFGTFVKKLLTFAKFLGTK